MKRFLFGVFCLCLSGCSLQGGLDEVKTTPVQPKTVEIVYNECTWVKPIKISKRTADILLPYITEKDVKEDINAIYLHNTLYDVHCIKPQTMSPLPVPQS